MAEKSERKEDFLEVDQTIPGQNYTCMSFVSPDKIISEKKDFISFKYIEHLFNNELECKSLKDNCKLSNYSTKLEDFRVGNQTELDKEYNELSDFQTSVRGVKVRGTYETEREAKVRAEVLRRRFPNDNVFVGQVGYWLPWDPNPLDVKNLEYQENELNTLMKKYNENMEHREFMFDEERRTKLDKAKKENEEQKSVNEGDKSANEGEKSVDEESVEYDDKHRKKFSEFRDILNEKDALMNGADPWIQRKEESLKDSKSSDDDVFEDVSDGKTEEECILKDEDVEQSIEINYNNSNNDPVEEVSSDPPKSSV